MSQFRRPRVRPVAVLLALAVVTMGMLLPTSAAAAGRIIGGEKVASDDWDVYDESLQSVVSIVYRFDAEFADTHTCTGVAIAPRLVLTARHCVESPPFMTDPNELAVISGARDRRLSANGFDLRAGEVTRIFRSPSPSRTFMADGGDLAILETAKRLKVPLMPYARAEHEAWWGGPAGRADGIRIAGWGVMEDASLAEEREFGPTVAHLRVAAVPIHPVATCAAIDPTDAGIAKHLCVGRPVSETGAAPAVSCHGDSGGPVIASDPAGVERDRLVGIVSHGMHVECATLPAQDVIVARHTAWIDSIVQHRGIVRPPKFRVSRTKGRLGRARIKLAGGSHRGRRYQLSIMHGDGGSWIAWKRFTGASTSIVVPPVGRGSARWSIRVQPIATTADKFVLHDPFVTSWRDRRAPAKIAKLTARRDGVYHQLRWTAPRDRDDRVIAVIVEQRKVGSSRWKHEATYNCGACWTRASARPPRRGTHMMLPGRRQFRIAALDRAGNLGPWTVSRAR